jgi:thymidylate kinase
MGERELNTIIKPEIIENDSLMCNSNVNVEVAELLHSFGLLSAQVENNPSSTQIHYFKNNDGSIRWIWPANARKPYFLDLYNLGNFKSKLFAFAAKFAFSIGLSSFFKHGKINLNAVQITNRDWAIFTGTIGPNRKAILRIGVAESTEFRKLPFSDEAINNLQNEREALNFLSNNHAHKYFEFPRLIQSNNPHIFIQSTLKGKNARSESSVLAIDLKNFLDWSSSLAENKICSYLVPTFKEELFNPSFIADLKSLNTWCVENPISLTVPRHGDFTPWNCKMLDKRLQILDWEMFSENGIPLEDVFHYVYQQAILVDRLDLKGIRARISEVLLNENVQQFIQKHKLNPEQLELHYLNKNIHYYLNVYSNQQILHIQVNWLLETWGVSINYLLKKQNIAVRKSVLYDLQMHSIKLNYALLKFNLSELSQTPETSDIDICTTKEDAKSFVSFFENHPFVATIKVKNLVKMLQIEVILLDGSKIDLDLIFKFLRKNIQYLDASEVLKSRGSTENGMWLASIEMNRKYILLFYSLNNSNIPKKHLIYFENNASTKDFKVIKKEVVKSKSNHGFSYLLNTLSYAIEILKSMGSCRKGFLVTFSGVDGAGKSTVIENIKLELEKKHRRRVIVLRHRPSILPIISAFKYGKKNAEQKSASTLPRQGTNSGKLSSIIRFTYYLFDYVFGQWWIYFRHVRKDTIVLYDRYYFDFINDSKRSNISLKPSFAERFYKLLRKPEFNFFLWAAPDVILKRKQELDYNTIHTLTNQYTSLFNRLQSADKYHVYRCIENIEIRETVNLMMRIIEKKMHEADFYPINTTSQS